MNYNVLFYYKNKTVKKQEVRKTIINIKCLKVFFRVIPLHDLLCSDNV